LTALKATEKELVFWELFSPPIYRPDVSRQVRNEVETEKDEVFDSMSGPRINEINSGQPNS
jgi:hypothetical protein